MAARLIPVALRLVAPLAVACTARAEVSIYEYPVPRPTPGYTYKGWQAYDPAQPLQDPPLPASPPPLDFAVELDTSGSPTASNAVLGSFLGISIEMSLAEAVVGPNSSWLRPQFLNLMSTLKERGGPPVLRLGGNTQEKAVFVDALPGGAASGKIKGEAAGATGFTNTPAVLYTRSILEALRAASDILGIQWVLGIPMNVTNPPRLDIMEQAEPILGDYLWGWQLGNEPDLYLSHSYRKAPYDVPDYLNEFQQVIDAINQNPSIVHKTKLGGPAVCCFAEWSTDVLIKQYGYLDRFGGSLSSLIMEQYPAQNCQSPDDPQATLERYMNHSAAVTFREKYQTSVDAALAAGKPVVLLETNTASCNGFIGLSDSFASVLWATDMAMQLASASWSHMMLHLGGQAAYYNPFVPPPHNASAPFQWTVGPIFYGVIAVAEALGDSGQARVADLNANQGNPLTPAYVIYENNQPARLLFINFMSDPSGAHDYTAHVATGASQVRARYLQAAGGTVTSKANVTWAGQSFGSYFESDGLLRGEHETVSIPCSGGSCPIHVPGPSVVLVFLTEASYEPADSVLTFATSHTTLMHNTAAVDGLTLQTSNGLDADLRGQLKGSGTSKQKGAANASARAAPFAGVAFALVLLAILSGL